MTFSDYILATRRRLFDTRKQDASLITSAADDGIRWSSSLLQDICKGAIQQVYRLFSVNEATDYINMTAFHQIIPGVKIEAGTGKVMMPGSITIGTILQIQWISDLKQIYKYVSPKKFEGMRYMTSQNTADLKVFTVFYDAASKTQIAYTLPLSATDIDVQAVSMYNVNDLLTLDSVDNLPFNNIDDILLDFSEIQARMIEGNPQQADITLRGLQLKLTEMNIGLPTGTS